MKLSDLRPGERFTTVLGDTWELAEHAGDVSWAVRRAANPKREDHWIGPPVAVGARDRFHPNVRVQLVGAQKDLTR